MSVIALNTLGTTTMSQFKPHNRKSLLTQHWGRRQGRIRDSFLHENYETESNVKPTEYPEDTSDFSGSAYDIIQAGITIVQRR